MCIAYEAMCIFVHLHVHVRVCVCMCACACVYARADVGVHECACECERAIKHEHAVQIWRVCECVSVRDFESNNICIESS